MQITLPPELEPLIQRHLTNGTYETVTDLLIAALHRLDDELIASQAEDTEALKQAVQIGWEALQRGKVIDGPTAMNQLLTDLRSRYPQP